MRSNDYNKGTTTTATIKTKKKTGGMPDRYNSICFPLKTQLISNNSKSNFFFVFRKMMWKRRVNNIYSIYVYKLTWIPKVGERVFKKCRPNWTISLVKIESNWKKKQNITTNHILQSSYRSACLIRCLSNCWWCFFFSIAIYLLVDSVIYCEIRSVVRLAFQKPSE